MQKRVYYHTPKIRDVINRHNQRREKPEKAYGYKVPSVIFFHKKILSHDVKRFYTEETDFLFFLFAKKTPSNPPRKEAVMLKKEIIMINTGITAITAKPVFSITLAKRIYSKKDGTETIIPTNRTAIKAQ
ncbi:MAG: hypothetical protein AAB355_00570 [Patescibacteria group bacterium]